MSKVLNFTCFLKAGIAVVYEYMYKCKYSYVLYEYVLVFPRTRISSYSYSRHKIIESSIIKKLQCWVHSLCLLKLIIRNLDYGENSIDSNPDYRGNNYEYLGPDKKILLNRVHLLAGWLEVAVVDVLRPADVAHVRSTYTKFREGSIVNLHTYVDSCLSKLLKFHC